MLKIDGAQAGSPMNWYGWRNFGCAFRRIFFSNSVLSPSNNKYSVVKYKFYYKSIFEGIIFSCRSELVLIIITLCSQELQIFNLESFLVVLIHSAKKGANYKFIPDLHRNFHYTFFSPKIQQIVPKKNLDGPWQKKKWSKSLISKRFH